MKTPTGYDVLVARSKEGNLEMLEKLSRRGVRAASVETIRLEDPEDWSQVDAAVGGVEAFDWVAFTSPRAVAIFRKRLGALSVDPKSLVPKFAAVGSKTAAALDEMGVTAKYVPGEYLTSALGRGLPRDQGRRVLLLRADIGDRGLVSILEARGFAVTDVALYRTKFVEDPVDMGPVGDASVVVFASPSEVEGFHRRLGEEFGAIARRATAVCIGPVTARAAEASGFVSVEYSSEHTTDALAKKVGEMLVHA